MIDISKLLKQKFTNYFYGLHMFFVSIIFFILVLYYLNRKRGSIQLFLKFVWEKRLWVRYQKMGWGKVWERDVKERRRPIHFIKKKSRGRDDERSTRNTIYPKKSDVLWCLGWQFKEFIIHTSYIISYINDMITKI